MSVDPQQAVRSLRSWSPVAGVELHERVYAPGTKLSLHSHEPSTLILVLDGGFGERCDGQDVDRSPGQLRVMPTDALHANHYGERGARCFVVDLHEAWLGRGASRRSSVAEAANYSRDAQPSVLVRSMWDDFQIADEAAALAVEGFLLETLSALLRTSRGRVSSSPPAWLRVVRDRLQQQYTDPPRISELAADARVHPAHLHRSFRAHYGCTPGAYIRSCRIEWARGALLESDEAVATIALRAGFCDQAHFARRFRKDVGVAPAAYRRMHR